MMSKIVLFGAGHYGEKFLLEHFDTVQIHSFFDNNRKEPFHGYEVTKPYYQKGLYIIVTVRDNVRYHKIREQLISLGYCEFDDFIPYTIFRKKIAVAYGNCHMEAVKNYMESSYEFNKEWGFYPLYVIQQMTSDYITQMRDVIKYANLILHQSIRKDNSYGEQYASTEIIKYASNQCMILSVPNLYGLPKCFFPQLKKNPKEPHKTLIGIYHNGIETNISKWVDENKSLQEITKMLSNGGVYRQETIIEMWDEFQDKLLSREAQWDIKISDYIFSKYKSEKLFTNTWHITTFLAREIANRTLSKLGYPEINIIIPCLDDYEVFIYKDVKEALGLEYEEIYIRCFCGEGTGLKNNAMNYTDYIELCFKLYTYNKRMKQ